MNTKTRYIPFVFALVLALSTLGIATSTALAQKPVKSEYQMSTTGVLTGVCTFDITNDSTNDVTEIDYFDQSGSLTRMEWHIVEQDTFTANGKSLVGIPFTFNVKVLFDSQGFMTHVYADGVTEKIWLPDGRLFISAGRVDFAAHGFPQYILSPDYGNPGNIAGFCAALAP